MTRLARLLFTCLAKSLGRTVGRSWRLLDPPDFHELQCRVPKAGKHAVCGGLVDGVDDQDRIPVGQPAALFAPESVRPTGVDVADDLDLITVHARILAEAAR
jgi:hypothetical protein